MEGVININFSPKIFPKTAFGKTLKMVILVAASGAVAAIISFVTNNPSLFNFKGYAVGGIVIIVLRAIEKVADPNIANF